MSPGGRSPVQAGPDQSWEGTDVAVAEVVHRLAELRDRAVGKAIHGRSMLLNLVVWACDRDDEGTAASLLERISGPSRIVVLRAGAADRLDARVEVYTRPSITAGATVCEELVTLDIGPSAAPHASSVVTPLLRGDLVTFVHWPTAPDPGAPVYVDLGRIADRLVLDAGRAAPGPAALALLADEIAGRDAAVTDLAWASLTPWRQLFAQLVGPDLVAGLRAGPGTFEVVHGGPEPTLEALLLAGWMVESIGPTLTATFAAEPDAEEPIVRMRLTGPEGRCLRLEEDGGARVAVSVDEPGSEARRRTLPVRRLDRTELIAGELELRRRDLTFERAVAAGRALVGGAVTAA